jgi:hypothetical protein
MKQLYPLLALLACLLPGAAHAQRPVKQDLLQLFDQVPAPLSAPSCGAPQPATFTSFNQKMQQLGREIATARSAEQTQDEAAMQAYGAKLKADEVDKMSEARQREYALKNMASTPGMTPQSAKMMQMMQDPAMQARLATMSDQEKAVFLQQQLAPPGSSTQRMVNDPVFQAAQGEFMREMQNPAFAAAWKKKSVAEQDAYMKQLMKKHGLDQAHAKAIAGRPAPGQQPMTDLVTTKALQEYSKLADPANKVAAQAEWEQARTRYNSELDAIRKAAAEPYSNTVPPCAVQKARYERRQQGLRQQMEAATRYLKASADIWARLKAEQKARLTPYNAELARIHYGDDIQRPEEKKLLASLGGGQQITLSTLEMLSQEAAASYEVNKEYCELKATAAKPFVCEENTCFPAAARVLLADGRPLAIAAIRAGMLVRSVDAATGQLSTTRVRAVQIHQGQDYPLLRLRFARAAVLAAGPAAGIVPWQLAAEVLATPNHPFLSNEGPVRADELRATQAVPFAGAQGSEAAFLLERTAAGTAPVVYSLQTEAGCYFVEGVLVGEK